MFLINNPLASTFFKRSTGLFIALLLTISACGGSKDGAANRSGALTPASIIISNTAGTPGTGTASISITRGQPTTFTATATYNGGPNKDVTSLVSWTYDKSFVSSIDSKGVVTVSAEGESKITASLDSQSASIQFIVKPLTSPIGVQAVSNVDSVTLSWTPVTDAISYNIYIATTAGVNSSSTKFTSNTASYLQASLTAGSTYYYRVSAVNPGAESPLSAETFSFVYSGGNPAASLAATGSMATGRSKHSSTTLADGKVLLAGGLNIKGYHASAELYNPASTSFSPTGSMSVARFSHTATRMADGNVLITGGGNAATTNYYSSAEVYTAGTFSMALGGMAAGRINHTATQLNNGKVLIIGGKGTLAVLKTAELYDPATKTFSATADLAVARTMHTATLLADGKVLVVGGSDGSNPLASAELYDPATGKFSAVANLVVAGYGHTATLLPGGKVLIAGGFNTNALKRAELYDTATQKFTTSGSLNAARLNHTANLLPNGKVLLSGGEDGAGGVLVSTELFDPATSGFSNSVNLGNPMSSHAASVLANGKVLITGNVDVWTVVGYTQNCAWGICTLNPVYGFVPTPITNLFQ